MSVAKLKWNVLLHKLKVLRYILEDDLDQLESSIDNDDINSLSCEVDYIKKSIKITERRIKYWKSQYKLHSNFN